MPVDAAAIRRLRAEIASDRRALTARSAEVRTFSQAADPLPAERPSALALGLDRTYTSLESVLERIARTLEGGLPEGPDWHRSLLGNASLNIDKVRPSILGAEAQVAADELRRLRHFLRHAYAATLEWERLRLVATSWLAAESRVQADLDAFEAFLDQLANTLDQAE